MDIFNKVSKLGLFLTLNQVVLQVQGCHVLGSETIMFCPKNTCFGYYKQEMSWCQVKNTQIIQIQLQLSNIWRAAFSRVTPSPPTSFPVTYDSQVRSINMVCRPMTCTNVNASVDCRNYNFQDFILATGRLHVH